MRAVILGLMLGLFVAGATYFNDHVIRQTFLVGNHLPIAVFGPVLLLLIVGNPLLRLLGRKLPLRTGEVAVIAAVGLAACGWPGSSFFRVFTTNIAMPGYWQSKQSGWKSQEVMSYVPGGSARIAAGQVQDWDALASRFAAFKAAPEGSLERVLVDGLSTSAQRAVRRVERGGGLDASTRTALLNGINDGLISVDAVGGGAMLPLPPPGGEAPSPPLTAAIEDVNAARAALVEAAAVLPEPGGEAVEGAGEGDGSGAKRQAARLHAAALRDRAAVALERANRGLLVTWLGREVVLPMPEGEGLLLAGGRADPEAVDLLVQGTRDRFSLTNVPWGVWWPTLKLWGGLAMLMGIASLLLALIVHPQWSRRELLPYPISRFLIDASRRRPGGVLPEVMRNKWFWIAAGGVFALHGLNGLHEWFNWVPGISLRLDFTPLKTLFPNASRVPGSDAYFRPQIYFTVIAFAFFLTGAVSLSLGLAPGAFMLVGSILLAQGIAMEYDMFAVKKTNMLRFGAYVGIAVMIAYTGRRYYLNVVASGLGLKRHPETPRYATWAARLLLVCVAGMTWLLMVAGLTWGLSLAFVLMTLLTLLVLSRVVAETGAFFLQPGWVPVSMLVGLLGVEQVGPTGYIILAVASGLLIADTREVVMPYLVTGLQMVQQGVRRDREVAVAEGAGESVGGSEVGGLADGGSAVGLAADAGERAERVAVGRAAWPIGAMVVVGLLVAGAVTLGTQYGQGVDKKDLWAWESLPRMPFNELTKVTSDLASTGDLAASTAGAGLGSGGGVGSLWDLLTRVELGWTMLGMAVVIAVAAARLRLAWWPIHPVLFLVWGTFPINQFAFSFLIGWAVKAAVIRTTGSRGYHAARPIIIGLIAGELLAALTWTLVGGGYFLWTGVEPVSYQIFPG